MTDKHKHRRRVKGKGGRKPPDDDVPKRQIYLNPQSANTVHGFQGGYPTRPGFHDSYTGVSSLVHLPSPPIYGQLPDPYGPVKVANPPPTWNPTVCQAPKPTSDLMKWTSCVNISQSVSNLVAHTAGKTNDTILELENLVLQSVSGGTNMRQSASRLLDEVITLIDLGSFCGKENELSM